MLRYKPLEEYAWFIEKIREYKKTTEDVKLAVKEALKKMPRDFMIRSFLLKHKAEITGMLDTEYNEDEIRELFMEDGRREQRAKTEEAERRADEEKKRADAAENIILESARKMKRDGFSEKKIAEYTGLSTEEIQKL